MATVDELVAANARLTHELAAQREKEEFLRANELNFQLTVDSIPGMVHTMTATGGVEFVNHQILDFFGKTREELDNWGQLVHPDDRSRVVELWTRSVATGEPFDVEHRVLRAGGTYCWLHARGLPLRDISGNIVRWYNLLTNIDDRKRAEEAIRASELQFRLLVETIPALVWRGTPEGELDYLNQRAVDYLGHSAESLTGGRWIELVHPDHRDTTVKRWRHSTTAGSSYNDVYRLRRADGQYRWIQSVGEPFRDAEGRIAHWYGLVIDVTDNMAAEQDLSRARSELAHVSRVTTLSTLTASIAHEVNQPLSGIITNASTCLRMLAADPPDVDGARETARRTIRDGNRAADVIARLRALFSRREFTFEPLDLNEVTREVIALSLSDLVRQEVVLQSELAPDLPTISGDRIQLQQVVLNLLRNASDAMVDVHDRPRHVLIRTERERTDRVRMTVRDTGVGVDPHSLEKLFDAFYTTKSGGMGIGLSVSRSIVERHHGRLWAEPNDGAGATFLFSIPLEPQGLRL